MLSIQHVPAPRLLFCGLRYARDQSKGFLLVLCPFGRTESSALLFHWYHATLVGLIPLVCGAQWHHLHCGVDKQFVFCFHLLCADVEAGARI